MEGEVSSSVGHRGNWTIAALCHETTTQYTFIRGFDLQVEEEVSELCILSANLSEIRYKMTFFVVVTIFVTVCSISFFLFCF